MRLYIYLKNRPCGSDSVFEKYTYYLNSGETIQYSRPDFLRTSVVSWVFNDAN